MNWMAYILKRQLQAVDQRTPVNHGIVFFLLLTSGLNVFRDPLEKKFIIAIIKFTSFYQLTPSEKDYLNFISTFLHQKNPSSAQSARGSPTLKSRSVVVISKILIFLSSLISITINSLQDLYNIPSFADLSYGKLAEDSNFLPHITPTTNGFFNPPHKYQDHISQYAFVLWLPTSLSDGSLLDSSEHDITSTKKYAHCNMTHSSSQNFTCLGLFVQINSSLSSTFDRCNKDFYKDF
ncbi:hypothetical protein VP01_951g9 [Puccinia sorghi]|uniref:Tet-like 2OG-Fe(II) oxygenase domain-containing protein n=1 Tax=Puccinia sorghi TaxID=27349 RepID=A0A0L6U6D0_9BASI|nr:hypothetical protein VP01_951g9 [Puccinia sorghi]